MSASPKYTEAEMQQIWEIASQKGEAAAVAEYEKRGDHDACGFAWVVVRPGNSRFAKWLKKNSYASAHYNGGVSVWCSFGGTQSMNLREAKASAIAEVFQYYGFNAYAGSRMD